MASEHKQPPLADKLSRCGSVIVDDVRLAECTFPKMDPVDDAGHMLLTIGAAAGCIADGVRRNRNAAAVEYIAHADGAGMTKSDCGY